MKNLVTLLSNFSVSLSLCPPRKSWRYHFREITLSSFQIDLHTSVTRFGKISHFGNILKTQANYVWADSVFGKIWTCFGHHFMTWCKFSLLDCGLMLTKNLAIWSHCHTQTLSVFTLSIFLSSTNTIAHWSIWHSYLLPLTCLFPHQHTFIIAYLFKLANWPHCFPGDCFFS